MTRLIIQQIHLEAHHPLPIELISILWQKYWVTKGRPGTLCSLVDDYRRKSKQVTTRDLSKAKTEDYSRIVVLWMEHCEVANASANELPGRPMGINFGAVSVLEEFRHDSRDCNWEMENFLIRQEKPLVEQLNVFRHGQPPAQQIIGAAHLVLGDELVLQMKGMKSVLPLHIDLENFEPTRLLIQRQLVRT